MADWVTLPPAGAGGRAAARTRLHRVRSRAAAVRSNVAFSTLGIRARTAEYAQDKLEQLISLAYNNTVTDTTVFPAVNSNGVTVSPEDLVIDGIYNYGLDRG